MEGTEEVQQEVQQEAKPKVPTPAFSRAGRRFRLKGGVAVATGHVLPDGRIVLENYVQDGQNLRQEFVAADPNDIDEFDHDEA